MEMPNPRDLLYRKMAGRGGWAHLDLADALKVMEKEKTFHIATIKWLIVLIPVLIPDCLSNIYLLEVEIYAWINSCGYHPPPGNTPGICIFFARM